MREHNKNGKNFKCVTKFTPLRNYKENIYKIQVILETTAYKILKGGGNIYRYAHIR